MERIHDTANRVLVWEQRDTPKLEHTLAAGDAVLATLRMATWWSTMAEVVTAEERWTFERFGFWRPRSTVRPAASEEIIATFEPRWIGIGELATSSGTRYRWDGANFRATTYVWKDAEDRDLVRFDAKTDLLTVGATVEILPSAAGLREVPLLVCYGYYLLVMVYLEVAASSGATGEVASEGEAARATSRSSRSDPSAGV